MDQCVLALGNTFRGAYNRGMREKSKKTKTTGPKRRQFDQWKIANPWHRLAAQIIDQSLIGFFTGFVLNFGFSDMIWTGTWWFAWFLLWPFVSLAVQSFSLLYFGTTPGKRPFGIVIKSANPTQELTAWQILTRASGWWIGALTLGAGWVTVLSRSDRRAWHDIVAETIVVNPIGEAHRPASWEKAFGHFWIVAVSMSFISILSYGLVLQIEKLRGGAGSQAANRISQVNNLAWSLVVEGDFKIPRQVELDSREMLFAKLLQEYADLREYPSFRRKRVYQEKMSPLVKDVCISRDADPLCQSAKVLGRLAQGKTAGDYLYGFSALKILVEVNKMTNKEAAVYLGKQALTKELHSPAYFAMKTAQAQKYLSMGRYKRAAELLEPDVNFYSHNPQGVQFGMYPETLKDMMAQNLIQTACLASALNGCRSEIVPQCQKLQYWNEYAEGCGAKEISQFISPAHGFGYWNRQVKKSGKKNPNLANWTQFKKKFSSRFNRVERDMVSYLDLSLAAKSSEASQVMTKANKVSSNNLFFMQAHRTAYKEFGNQWLAVVKPSTKAELAQKGIITLPVEVRGLASKKGKKKSKKRR